jgi:hypothetical protein
MLFVAGGALEAYTVDTAIPKPVKTHPHLPAGGSTTFTVLELRDLNDRPFRADWFRMFPDEPGFDVQITDKDRKITLKY